METLISNSGAVKTIWRNGREYLRVPASLIVPGVLGGSNGDLYYPPSEVRKNPEGWNSIPVTVYHPTINGRHVSATAKGIRHYGWLENAKYNDKLTAVAYLDVRRLKTHPEGEWVINELSAGRQVELSTGLFTTNDERFGIDPLTGRRYTHVARDYRPDHLAILPSQKGACSLKDGCGLNVNTAGSGQCSACASGNPCTGKKKRKKRFLDPMIQNAKKKKSGGRNCGIGTGGFQHGNHCASGGGGTAHEQRYRDAAHRIHKGTTLSGAKGKENISKASTKDLHEAHSAAVKHAAHAGSMGEHGTQQIVSGVAKQFAKELKRRGEKPTTNSFGGLAVLKKKLIKFLTVNCAVWKGQEQTLNTMDERQLKMLKRQADKAAQADDMLMTVKDTLGQDDLTANTLGERLKASILKAKTLAPTAKQKVTARKPVVNSKDKDDDDADDDSDDDDDEGEVPAGYKPQKGAKVTANADLEEEYEMVVRKARQGLANEIVNNMSFSSKEARVEEYKELLELSTKQLEKKLSRLAANKGRSQLDDQLPPGYRDAASYEGAALGGEGMARPVANMKPIEDQEVDWKALSVFSGDDSE